MKIIFSTVVLSVLAWSFLTSCKTIDKPFRSAQELEPLPGGGSKWTFEVDVTSRSLVNPPESIPWFSGILLGNAEKKFGKELLPGRILTWSTDLGIGSGVLEMYIEKGAEKILELV